MNRLSSSPPRRLRQEALPDNPVSYPMRGLRLRCGNCPHRRASALIPRDNLAGKVTARRHRDGSAGEPTRYYLLSQAFSPERFNDIVRGHWGIENRLHWTLDVTCVEDQSRNRKGHGPENLALLRKLALNLAGWEPSQGSRRSKLKRAGWDNGFLINILTQFTKIHCDSPGSPAPFLFQDLPQDFRVNPHFHPGPFFLQQHGYP